MGKQFNVDDLLARKIAIDGPAKTIKRVRSGGLTRLQYQPGEALALDLAAHRDVEVRVCATHITVRNDGLKKRLVWGAREYTAHSDIVAMLVHSGTIAPPRARSNASTRPLPYAALIVTLRVRQGEGVLTGCLRNGLQSRTSIRDPGARVLIRKVVALDVHGNEVSLPPHVPVLTSTPPLAAVFDLANHPAIVYCLQVVADRGNDRSGWPSKRLTREVLYVESSHKRFEITKVDPPERREDGKPPKKGLYVRFSQVKPDIIRNELLSDKPTNAPLNESQIRNPQVLRWTALKWDPTGLSIAGLHYPLRRVLFKPKSSHPINDDNADKKHSDSKS